MTLPELAIKNKAVTYFSAFLLVVGGAFSYFQLGQLEDPEFTVKTATVITFYPGASAEEVELEVTDRIETKIQEMPELKEIQSISRAGRSILTVDIKQEYWSDRLPQVWDVLRKKIRDIEHTLPPGAHTPMVGDDFGFVLGFLVAITGDGYSYAELEEYTKELRKELITVPNVARIDLWGVQDKRIYLEVSQTQVAALGLTAEDLQRTLALQNAVVDAGRVDVQTKRFRIAPTGAFASPEDIENLAITGTLGQKAATAVPAVGGTPAATRVEGEIIRIKDFAKVRRGYAEPPVNMMRYNGQPAIGLALAPESGANIVDLGKAVEARMQEIAGAYPVGIEVHQISWQSDLVEESITGFMINLAQAIVIVLVVLAATMGVLMGFIIGVSGLLFAILGTFIAMAIWGIDLQRVSLGALIIAMGMMVDNAIVVADGFAVRLQQGVDRRKAAIDAANIPAWPLLGATIVACMAFFPIFASTQDTGEYAGSLFIVVAISLLISWVLSQTVTPIMCMELLPDPKKTGGDGDVYGGRFYQVFRGLLATVIRIRLLFLGGMVVLLIAAFLGFGFVQQIFFPDASRLQFTIDYWQPEGTRIQTVSAELRSIESALLKHPQVESVSAFIGQGPPRFYLPVDPEMPYSSYAQLIVNTKTLKGVDELIAEIEPWLEANYPGALTRVRKYGVGSWTDWKIEARFGGPSNADPDVLRALGEKGKAILEASPIAKEVRTNWRERVRKIVPEYAMERARWSGVSRDDLANATKRAFDGVPVGQFREGDDLIPIVVRLTEDERQRAAATLGEVQIIPFLSTQTVPLAQVTDDIGVVWEDPIIWRFDRSRTITVQSSPNNATTSALRNSVLAAFEAIELPPGYRLEWGGEYETQRDSMAALVPGIVPTVVIMVFIIVLLFNAYRPPVIIFAVIPFAFIGIAAGLLVTGAAFGFMALLGAMSLSGMMIKNAVVLLDQVNLNLAEGMKPYDAIVESAVSRLRPVANAAATTIFGMAPLLTDVFWYSMAITIMAGLLFGTILTMVVVPVLYATLYRIPSPAVAGGAARSAGGTRSRRR